MPGLKKSPRQHIIKVIFFIDAQLEFIKWEMMSDGYEVNSTNDKKSMNNKLKWTGSIVEVVESAYATLECKSFNNGNI